MNIFFTCFLIAVSLSMDTFSLSIVYGTYGISMNNQIVLSIVVGVFHFFMPLIGVLFGNLILEFLSYNTNFIVGIIFGIIGVDMILSVKSDKKIKLFTSIVGYLLFGFTVSLDSLTIGIGLSLITTHYIGASVMFMIVSCLFTFFGLKFGDFFSKRVGRYSCFLGGVIMLILSLYYIF